MIVALSSLSRRLPSLRSSVPRRASLPSLLSTVAMPGGGFDYPMELAERPAVCSLVPPGQCQFTPSFQSVPLLDRIPCGTGGTSYVLRFGLPDQTKPMNLSTCACILVKAELMDDEKKEVVDVIRPYTPISANDQVGCFDLLVKDYGEMGWMSKHLCEDLKVGEKVDFKHIDFNVKIQAPFNQKKIGIIAGGTGITPMMQALHAILGPGSKSTVEEVTMLYGSRSSDDILGGEMLERWSNDHPGKFTHVDVLSDEKEGTGWMGETGFIDAAKIKKYLPPASLGDDAIIFVCGPPIMYKILCGPRNEKEVTGVLGELGYKEGQVFKF